MYCVCVWGEREREGALCHRLPKRGSFIQYIIMVQNIDMLEFNGNHQGLAHDYVMPSAPTPLHTSPALYHTMGGSVFEFSSTASPSALTRVIEDGTDDHHLLINSASPYMEPCGQQKERQEVEEADEAALGLVSCLPTCSSLIGPNNDHHHDLDSSYNSYKASSGSVCCASTLSSAYDTLFEHVPIYDSICHGQLNVASQDLSFLKDQFRNEDYSSLVASDANMACYLNCLGNGDGRNPRVAALPTSSSSSSTPSSMPASQIVREANMQAWNNMSSFKQNEVGIINNSRVHMVNVDMLHCKRRDMADVSVCASVDNSIGAEEQQHVVIKKKRRKRKRMQSYKNVEEMETQRMTHIAVERNRRKQMNEHLRALRLLMPHAYTQRGDQASIVGATITFVEELEQVLQSLKLQKQLKTNQIGSYGPHGGENLEQVDSHVDETYGDTQSCMVNVEITKLTSSTLFLKIKAIKKTHQLLHTLLVLSNLSLRVTHLSITTIGLMTTYLLTLEVDDVDCQLLTSFELAQLIKHMLCLRNMLTSIED